MLLNFVSVSHSFVKCQYVSLCICTKTPWQFQFALRPSQVAYYYQHLIVENFQYLSKKPLSLMNEEYNEEELVTESCNRTQAAAFYKVVLWRSYWKLLVDMHCSKGYPPQQNNSTMSMPRGFRGSISKLIWSNLQTYLTKQTLCTCIFQFGNTFPTEHSSVWHYRNLVYFL